MTAVEIRCPSCNRFLVEASGAARVVCASCGCEIAYTSKEMRAERVKAK